MQFSLRLLSEYTILESAGKRLRLSKKTCRMIADVLPVNKGLSPDYEKFIFLLRDEFCDRLRSLFRLGWQLAGLARTGRDWHFE